MGNVPDGVLGALSPSGNPLSEDGFSGGGLETPQGVAVDGFGNIWATNEDALSLTEFDPFGDPLSPNPVPDCPPDNNQDGCGGFRGGGLFFPIGIAADGANNIWVANLGVGVSEFDSSGAPLSPRQAFGGPEITGATSIAVDRAGNIWAGFGSVAEIVGAGVPVVTPLQARLSLLPSSPSPSTPRPIPTPFGPTPVPTPAPPPAPGPFALTSSTSFGEAAGSLTISSLAGLSPNDLLFGTIAIQGANASSATITIPPGWTEIRHDTCGTDLQISIAFRIADASNVSSAEYTWSFSDKFDAVGGVSAYFGVNPTSPIAQNSFACTLSGASVTAPAITTTQNNGSVVAVYGVTQDNFLLAPARLSQVYQRNISGAGPDIENAIQSIATLGTETGRQTATANVSGDGIGYQVELNSIGPPQVRNFVYTNDNIAGPNTVSGFAVAASGELTPVPGSPFLTGGTGAGLALSGANRIAVSGNLVFATDTISSDVSVFTVDPNLGTLMPVTGSPFSITSPSSPQFVTATHDGKFLFVDEDAEGKIFAFNIGSDGTLTPVSGSPFSSGGFLPAGMKVSADDQFLIVALFYSNSVAVLSIGADGSLSPVSGSPFAAPVNYECSAECGVESLDIGSADTFLYINLPNAIDIFNLAADGTLTPTSSSPFLPGSDQSGPTILLSPNQKFLFQANPSDNSITVLNVGSDGNLSANPDSVFPTASNLPDALDTDASGTFLFLASGDNTISVFVIGSDGVLSPVPGSPFATDQYVPSSPFAINQHAVLEALAVFPAGSTPTPSPTPTPTATPTPTPSATPTATDTPTATSSPSATPTLSATSPSASPGATQTPTPSAIATPTSTPEPLFLMITPPSVSFPLVGVDTTATMRVKLKNTGTSSLTGGVSDSGLSAPFRLTAGLGNFKLARNQTRVLTIKFAPTSAVESSGSITIASNDLH